MNVNLIAGFTDCPDNVQGVEAAEEAGERARGEELLLGGSRCAVAVQCDSFYFSQNNFSF